MCQAAKHLMFPTHLSNTAFFCKVQWQISVLSHLGDKPVHQTNSSHVTCCSCTWWHVTGTVNKIY